MSIRLKEKIKSAIREEIGEFSIKRKLDDKHSYNTNYVVEDKRGNKRFVKLTDRDLEVLQSTVNVQNSVAPILGPKNLFINKVSDYVVVCNDYLDGYMVADPFKVSHDEKVRIASTLTEIAFELHEEDFSASKFGKLHGENLVGKYDTEFVNNYTTDNIGKQNIIEKRVGKNYLKKLQDLNNRYREIDYDDNYVVHLTDFTMNNMLFKNDYHSGLIVDWEWVKRVPRNFAVVGIWFRLVRGTRDQELKREFWDIIKSRYNHSLPSYLDPEMRKYLLALTLSEIVGFEGWCRALDEREKKEHTRVIKDRIDRI